MFVIRGHLINLFIAGAISDSDIGRNVYQADNQNKHTQKFQYSSRSWDIWLETQLLSHTVNLSFLDLAEQYFASL